MKTFIEIINCIIELLIVLFFFRQMLNPRKLPAYLTNLIVFGVLAIHTVRSFFPVSVYTNFAISAMLLGIYNITLFKDFWLKKLAIFLLYFAVLISTDMLCRTILSVMTNTAVQLNTYTDIQRYIGMTLCSVLNLSILSFISVFAKKRLRTVDIKYWFMMMLFPVFSLFIVISCDFLIVLSGTSSMYYILLLTVIIIGLMYFNTMVFEFIEAYSAKLQLANAKELIRHQEQNYQLLEINERELRKLKHDISSHMQVMQMLLKNNSISQSSELMSSIQKLSALPTNITYTNDSALDSILNIECKKATDNGIKYTVTTHSMTAPINISALDKSTILCNALNNAIEAASLVNEKFVLIDISSNEKTVRIYVENSSLPLNGSHGKLHTTKSDTVNHGFGIESIRLTLQKYNGHLKISHSNGTTQCIIVADNKKI